MKKKTALAVSTAALVLLVSGCASKSDKIDASYVSPLVYSDHNCRQIKQELLRVNRKVLEVTKTQDKIASNDSVAMGVGLVVFWPALFFIEGSDKSDELARLKGEYDAIEQTAIQKECDVAEEVRVAQKQRKEYEAEIEARRKAQDEANSVDMPGK